MARAPALRTVEDILADADANPRAVIGGNSPPEPTPFEAAQAKVADIADEARLWLDGAKVESQEQADGLTLILDLARGARKLADDSRRLENEPFDTGKAEVQARYNPLLEQADRIATVVKATLGDWRNAKLAEQREAARLAAIEAERVADEARQARASVDATNLAAVEQAEALTRASETAQKAAAKAAKPTASGLRPVWSATITDRRAALNHYIVRHPDDFTALIQTLADRDARGTRGTVPGVEFVSRMVAV